MAWDAIIHGARGLTWFGFQYLSQADRLLADIGQVATEVHSLSKDLLSRVSLRDLRSSDTGLEATLLAGTDGLLLVVANRTNASISGTVGIGGIPFASISRVGAQCPLTMGENTLRDEFVPLSVHLYRVR